MSFLYPLVFNPGLTLNATKPPQEALHQPKTDCEKGHKREKMEHSNSYQKPGTDVMF